MAQNDGERRATDAVHAEMLTRGWTKKDLSEVSGVDYGTVSDLLAYERRIQARTQKAVEDALGWAPGTYRRLSLGQLDQPERLTEDPVGGADDDDGSLNYRRPEGLTDEQWRQLRARTRNMIEWEIEQALRQNRE